MKLKSVLAAISIAFLIPGAARADVTGDYVQDGLINMWDAVENAGVGVHDGSATVWKDLAGSLDMTMNDLNGTTRKWTDNSLVVDGCTAYGETATAAYRTLEVVYKMTDSSGRMLFASGCATGGNRRWVIFDSGVELYSDGGDTGIYAPHVVEDKIKSYSVCYSDSNAPATLAVNGVVLVDPPTQNNTWGLGDKKVMVGNRSVSGDTSYAWRGEVYAIRLYDRVLTSKEIAANHEVDVNRFVKGNLESVDVKVVGRPAAFGAPTPGYGNYSGLVDGQSYDFTCPAVYTNEAAGVAATCLGWELALKNGTRTSGTDHTKTIVYGAETARSTLTWVWESCVAVDMRIVVNGKIVRVERNWTDAEGDVTLTRPATPDGCEFVGWFGAGIIEESRYNETLELTRTEPGTAYAVFRTTGSSSTIYFVDDATGVDDSEARDGHSPETSWKTLGYAISKAAAGDMVVLVKGTHAFTASLTVNKQLTICGDGENWETVLDGNKSSLLTISADGVLLHNLTLYRIGGAWAGTLSLSLTGESTVSNVVVSGTLLGVSSGNGRYPVNASKGLLTHCWITNNFAFGNAGVGLSGAATMENCYIAGNTKKATGGYGSGVVEISSSTATMRNCTVVDNQLADQAALYLTQGANVYNNLIWGNVNFNTSLPANLGGSGATTKCFGNCSLPLLGTAENRNIADDPMLTEDRMHFKSASPCKGKAVPEYATATDLDGNPRGDHPSIGAFEYVDSGALEVALVRSATFARLPAGITVTNSVTGSYQEPLSYAWDFYGTGATNATTAAATITTPGIYRPTLTVTDANGKTASATFEENLAVHEEGSSVYYVSDETGSDDNSGLDPAAPMKTYLYALSSDLVVDGDVIELMKGVHHPSTYATVGKAVTIRGAGRPEETVIDGQGGTGTDRRLTVTASGAKICNLTMYRTAGNYGVYYAINMTGNSVVSNVVMYGNNATCKPTDSGNARYVAYLSDGLMTHCVITNNRAWGNAGVHVRASGRLENCLFADNVNFMPDYKDGGYGIVEIKSMSGATPSMINCTIVSNQTRGKACVRIDSDVPNVRQPIIANNIIWDNWDWEGVTNFNWQTVGSSASEVLTSNMTANCTWPLAGISGEKNIDDDPLFSAKKPYRLDGGSPCRNAGDNAYLTASVDLDGNPRRIGRRVDMGCYEANGPGFMLIVR